MIKTKRSSHDNKPPKSFSCFFHQNFEENRLKASTRIITPPNDQKNKKESEKTDFITLGWAALPEEEEEEEEERVQLQTYKQR